MSEASIGPFDDPFVPFDNRCPIRIDARLGTEQINGSIRAQFRHRDGTRAGILGVVLQMRRNQSPRSERISSGRKTALRTVVAWTPTHNEKTTLSSFPTVSVCCPIWPTPLEREGNRVVGPDPANRPASSAGRTPPRDVDSHVQSCARSDTLGFSTY